MIVQTRLAYGVNVPIVWAYYTDTVSYRQAAEKAITELGGEASGIYRVQLTFNKLGGNNHPNVESQLSQTEVLAKFIQDKKHFEIRINEKRTAYAWVRKPSVFFVLRSDKI